MTPQNLKRKKINNLSYYHNEIILMDLSAGACQIWTETYNACPPLEFFFKQQRDLKGDYDGRVL